MNRGKELGPIVHRVVQKVHGTLQPVCGIDNGSPALLRGIREQHAVRTQSVRTETASGECIHHCVNPETLLVCLVNEGLEIVEIRCPLNEPVAGRGPAVHPGLRLGVRGFEHHSPVGRADVHHEIRETDLLALRHFLDNLIPVIGKLLPVAFAAYPHIAVLTHLGRLRIRFRVRIRIRIRLLRLGRVIPGPVRHRSLLVAGEKHHH